MANPPTTSNLPIVTEYTPLVNQQQRLRTQRSPLISENTKSACLSICNDATSWSFNLFNSLLTRICLFRNELAGVMLMSVGIALFLLSEVVFGVRSDNTRLYLIWANRLWLCGLVVFASPIGLCNAGENRGVCELKRHGWKKLSEHHFLKRSILAHGMLQGIGVICFLIGGIICYTTNFKRDVRKDVDIFALGIMLEVIGAAICAALYSSAAAEEALDLEASTLSRLRADEQYRVHRNANRQQRTQQRERRRLERNQATARISSDGDGRALPLWMPRPPLPVATYWPRRHSSRSPTGPEPDSVP